MSYRAMSGLKVPSAFFRNTLSLETQGRMGKNSVKMPEIGSERESA